MPTPLPAPSAETTCLATGFDSPVRSFSLARSAPQILACAKELGLDMEKTNVNGGAIALGHPLGASGTKLMATLVHALKARGKKYGLQTMCEGGGVANVTIVEAL